MKVLMINVVCGIRSTGRICTDLATALETQGHEVKIAYGRENVPEQFQKYAVKIGTDLDVKLHGVKARLLDGAGFGSKKATEKFIEWVKEYDPDVIHLHNIHGYYINVEVLFNYLKTCGKKVIWTLHDCWAFTGHTAYCDAVNCERWITGCFKCPQKAQYPKTLIDRSKCNWLKKRRIMAGVSDMSIVTPSQWLANLVKESFLAEYPVEVIHNGIDTAQFMPLENDFKKHFGIQNKKMILGVATAWDDNKGINDYIRLSEMLDEDEYKVVLVGLTDEQIAKLPSNLLGLKRTNSIKELAQIYTAADFVLNLSKVENYPTVNLEALCCGTTVITYDVGGSKESVETANGIVVAKGDIDAVEKAIKNTNTTCDIEVDRESFDNLKTVTGYLAEFVNNEQNPGGGYWAFKSKLNLISKKVILGVASIWEPRKGLNDLIALSSMVPDDYQIVVIGVTEEQKENMPSNVISISRTNNVSELRDYYAIADIFVNPTYEDNYPTTNLEAIACGTPVVTYDTGGSGESASMYGVCIKKGDIDLLKKYVTNDLNIIMNNDISVDYHNTILQYTRLYS